MIRQMEIKYIVSWPFEFSELREDFLNMLFSSEKP